MPIISSGRGEPDQHIKDLEKRGVKIVSGDFTDPRSFDDLDRFDQVYMLASVVGVDYVNSIPHEIIRINSMLIINTLEWIRKKGAVAPCFHPLAKRMQEP